MKMVDENDSAVVQKRKKGYNAGRFAGSCEVAFVG